MSTGKQAAKKPLSPEAARILEQYRNATKGIPVGADGVATPEGGGTPVKPAGPPPAAAMRRSGSRGK